MFNDIKNKESGFSLAELLVAMAVFVIVIVTAVNTFSMVLASHRKISSQQEVIENGRFLLESMLKEIRFSKIYNDDGASLTLDIQNQEGEDVRFVFDAGAKSLTKVLSGGSVSLGNNNIEITGQFYVSRVSDEIGEVPHPLVTIIMKLEDGRTKQEFDSTISLQTSISPRSGY